MGHFIKIDTCVTGYIRAPPGTDMCDIHGLSEVNWTFAIHHSMANIKVDIFTMLSFPAIPTQLFIISVAKNHNQFLRQTKIFCQNQVIRNVLLIMFTR